MITIREADPTDGETLASIYLASAGPAYRPFMPPAVTRRFTLEIQRSYWNDKLSRAGYRYFVGELAGEPKGFIGIGPAAHQSRHTERVWEPSSVASGGPGVGWQGGGNPGSGVLPGFPDNEANRRLVDAQQEKRLLDTLSDVGEVHSLFVEPGAARQGLGRALLTTAERDLAATGYRQAVLWVFSANHAAREFYERVGWKPVPGTDRWDPELLHSGIKISDCRYQQSLIAPVTEPVVTTSVRGMAPVCV